MPRTAADREENQRRYLSALEKIGAKTKAIDAVGLSRSCLVDWRRDCEGFETAERAALAAYGDSLIQELTARVLTGIPEPVIFKGEQQFEKDPETGDLLRDEDGQPIPLIVFKKDSQTLIKGLEACAEGFSRKEEVVHSGFAGSKPAEIIVELVPPRTEQRENDDAAAEGT